MSTITITATSNLKWEYHSKIDIKSAVVEPNMFLQKLGTAEHEKYAQNRGTTSHLQQWSIDTHVQLQYISFSIQCHLCINISWITLFLYTLYYCYSSMISNHWEICSD